MSGFKYGVSKKKSRGYQYLLTVISCFAFFLWVKHLSSKCLRRNAWVVDFDKHTLAAGSCKKKNGCKNIPNPPCMANIKHTPPKFNSSPLKNGGWKTSLSYWVSATFQGLLLLNFGRVYMDVSENRGTPKSSILIGFAIINHPFWGTLIFGNTHILHLTLQRVPKS